jgi:hypothetical protein
MAAVRRPSARRRGNTGAVYVEFLIAFLPFFTFFLCLWQLSIFFSTKLMVDHAAITAARSAAVIMAEPTHLVEPSLMPNPSTIDSYLNTLTPQRTIYVHTAAELALAPLIADGTIVGITVEYPSAPGGNAFLTAFPPMPVLNPPVTMMVVRVTATMKCQIALADKILCRNGQTIPIAAEGIFPYQGATYNYMGN